MTRDETKVCIDLCAGLGGFSAAFEDAEDWRVFTVDVEPEFDPDLTADVLDLVPADVFDALGTPREAIDLLVVLASPPCTVFSLANPPTENWDTAERHPTSEKARHHITLAFHAMGLVRGLAPDYWFLENPRARLRWFFGRPTGTVTYCQYGRPYQKPTDLWGDHPAGFEYRTCPSGADCHAENTHGGSANTADPYPSDAADRAKVPYELSAAILEAVEGRPEQTTLAGAVA